MKRLLLLILVLIGSATSTQAQDTTRTPIGYDIDYPHVYVRVDTVHGLSYIYNYYPTRMHLGINGNRVVLVRRKQVITVWAIHFTLTASRKKYKRTYKI